MKPLPFQVIYGGKWIEAKFGKEYLARFPRIRKEIQESKWYADRE